MTLDDTLDELIYMISDFGYLQKLFLGRADESEIKKEIVSLCERLNDCTEKIREQRELLDKCWYLSVQMKGIVDWLNSINANKNN